MIVTTVATAIAQNVIVGWLWRRAQEIAAFIAGLAPFFMLLPPQYQDLVIGVLQGKGGGYSISVWLGFVGYLWTQWQSYRATVIPQVVTGEGRKIPIDGNSQAASRIEAEAVVALKPRTLAERLSEMFGRR